MAEREASSVRLGRAAALASGPAEVIDFLLPLWAASELGASPSTVGLVVAVEAVVSPIVRPGAGVLADRHDRSLVAAGGAALSAGAFALYAVASSIEVVGVGAALGGPAAPCFWVALRADGGTHLDEDPAAYARLLSSEQLGSVVAFVIALSLLGSLGYRPLFWLGGAAYLGALALLLAGRRPKQQRTLVGEDDRAVGLHRVGRVLAPTLGRHGAHRRNRD